VSQQDAFSSKPSPTEILLNTATSSASERAALVRAFERLESQLDRIEAEVHKIESHFHQLALRLVGNHGDLMKLLVQSLERIGGIETRLGAAEPPRSPPRPAAKPRSGPRKAA
jgi:hypothetical protein